jgi:hypothetical protein
VKQDSDSNGDTAAPKRPEASATGEQRRFLRHAYFLQKKPAASLFFLFASAVDAQQRHPSTEQTQEDIESMTAYATGNRLKMDWSFNLLI